MKGALAIMHLNMVHMFPRFLSWVPPRRRKQVRHADSGRPHTLVLARDLPRYHAWLGQNVPAAERKDYAFLSGEDDLEGFRGRIALLPGAWRRPDVGEVVEAVEPRVQCGAVRWAA